MGKRIVLLILVLLCLIGCLSDEGEAKKPPSSYAVTLAWNANDPAENVTGYRVYIGTNAGVYTESHEVNTTTAVIDGLRFNTTYYFAVTAYNEVGESGYSNEVSCIKQRRK